MLRPVKLRYYVAYMEEHGHTAAAVLADTGISPARLRDPALLVDPYQYEVAIRNMLRLSGDPALGFKVGASMQLNDMGIVAYAMMSSRTIREAALLSIRYHNLIGMTVQMSITEAKKNWATLFTASATREQAVRFYLEEILIVFLKIGEVLTGKHYVTQSVTIALPAPPHANLYRELLRCPVRFDAAQTTLTIRSPCLDTPLRGNDPEFHEICLRQCGQILRDTNRNNQVIARLRSFFLSQPQQLPTLDAAARHIGVSARTLRRHLEREGVGYQGLINSFRLDLAREYMKHEHLTAKEIGYLIGFRNISAFRRAFKAWTGETIRQFRVRNGVEDAAEGNA